MMRVRACWAAGFGSPGSPADRRSGQPGGPAGDRDRDRSDETQEQAPPPGDDRDAGGDRDPGDPDFDRVRARRREERVDHGDRTEDGRADELEVVEHRPRQAVDRRGQQPDRPRRIRHGPHQDRERDEVGAHGVSAGSSGTSGSGIESCMAYRRADASEPIGATSWVVAFGTSSPRSGPRTPPAMTPTVALTASVAAIPIAAPATAATSSRRPDTRSTARPAIAAGKITSIPSRAGSTIAAPSVTPASVARFQGMRVQAIAAYQ